MILGLSCQSAPQSAELSTSFTQSVLEWIPAYQNLTPEQQMAATATANVLMREIAHIATFTVLGFCASMLVRSYAICRWISVVFPSCAVFAVLDESVQHFLKSGRTFQLVDLLKDWAGVLLGMTIVALIGRMIRRKHREESGNGVSGTGT